MTPRTARIHRTTAETDVELTLCIDGTGTADIHTGLGFYDHMLGALARRIFGTSNDRVLRSLQRDVNAINALEPELIKLSDEELRPRTADFKERISRGEPLE